jgi:GAF domain-containing protein
MTRESRSSSASETARRTGAALAEVARLLARSLDPDVVARLVADSVRSLLGGQPSVVYRLDREAGNLVAIAISGDTGPGFGDRVVIPPGMGSVGVAVATRKPFTTEDLLTAPRVTFDESVRTRVAQGPFRSALAVPLLVKDQVIGALFVGDVAGRAFTEDDVRLAEAFADQAAVALNNAQLYDALTVRATRLRTLAELNPLVSSSLDQPEDHGRSRNAGFDAHLVKPIGPADLARIFTHAPRRLPAA